MFHVFCFSIIVFQPKLLGERSRGNRHLDKLLLLNQREKFVREHHELPVGRRMRYPVWGLQLLAEQKTFIQHFFTGIIFPPTRRPLPYLASVSEFEISLTLTVFSFRQSTISGCPLVQLHPISFAWRMTPL